MARRGETIRLAIISTHPIQYYAPWFRHLASHGVDLKVFYLLQPSESGLYDRGFGREIKWDTPLLEGYPYEFVANTSARPGTDHFAGLRNPTLSRQVAAFQPRAVLLIGYNYWSLLRFILGWRTREAPLIFRGDSHRLVRDASLSAGVRRLLVTALFTRFSAFLYAGAANLRYFTTHGVPRDALFHAPHAIDNERFSSHPDQIRAEAMAWRRSLGIPDELVLFLFAGKFEAKKRPLDLLRAFRSLEGGPPSGLLFVGNGPLEQQLRDEARGASNVYFAPFQNQSVMPRTYAAGSVLVLPSYGPYETWGLAVNEAMCVARAAIVSSHVGCAEDLVIPEETGLVFEAGNPEALAKSLRTALEDPARIARWGTAARRRIEAFTYDEATKGLMSAIAFAARRAPA